MRFPNTAEELSRALDALFPEVIPEPGDTLEDIQFSAGQRSVALYVKRWRDAAGKVPAPPRRRGSGRPVG